VLPFTIILWIVGSLLFFLGFCVIFIARARPTRSIAHILHDVEQPRNAR
jgi:cytochrome c-type biogenesis protein CcmH/NrfF